MNNTPLPPPDKIGFTIHFNINNYFVCQFLKMDDYSMFKHSWIITRTMYLVKNKTKQQQQQHQQNKTRTKIKEKKLAPPPPPPPPPLQQKTKNIQTNKTSRVNQQINEIKKNQKVISKEGLYTGVFVLHILIGLDTIYKCVRIFIVVLHNNIFLKSYISGITVFYFKSWRCQLGIYWNPDRNSANTIKNQH